MIKTILINVAYLYFLITFISAYENNKRTSIFSSRMLSLGEEIFNENMKSGFCLLVATVSVGCIAVSFNVSVLYMAIALICIRTYSLISHILYLSKTYDERKVNHEKMIKMFDAIDNNMRMMRDKKNRKEDILKD